MSRYRETHGPVQDQPPSTRHKPISRDPIPAATRSRIPVTTSSRPSPSYRSFSLACMRPFPCSPVLHRVCYLQLAPGSSSVMSPLRSAASTNGPLMPGSSIPHLTSSVGYLCMYVLYRVGECGETAPGGIAKGNAPRARILALCCTDSQQSTSLT
ncbi:hypothetical protein GQ53DRAFT_421586 [Thozetella sp. PMI_491]|nr:hypothetical protein GQ53DRAFT_421586 [Thozetella sp. PMI_491]